VTDNAAEKKVAYFYEGIPLLKLKK